MTRQRPAALTVIGIVNIVVGGIAVLVGSLGVLYFLNISKQARAARGSATRGVADLVREMERAIPGWLNMELAKAWLVLFLGAGLIIASIGLFMRPPWGRWYCMRYGMFAIALHGCYLAFQVGWVKPVGENWLAAQRRQMEFERSINPSVPAPPPQDKAFAVGAEVGRFGAAALFIAHGLALLCALSRWDVLEFFAAPNRVPGPTQVMGEQSTLAADEAGRTASPQELAGPAGLTITQVDAAKTKQDPSPNAVAHVLEKDGWHVDYGLNDPRHTGGGPQ